MTPETPTHAWQSMARPQAKNQKSATVEASQKRLGAQWAIPLERRGSSELRE